MPIEYPILEVRIRKKETRQVEGAESKKEIYPVELTLKSPGNADKEFFGSLSAEILHWKARGYSPEDGERMFNLFDSQFRESWAKVNGFTNKKFCLRLRFDDEEDKDKTLAPLHPIPWELLHDTTVNPAQNLVAGPNTPFSRYVTGTSAGKTIKELPIKILVAVASPKNLAGSSWAKVDEALEEKIITTALTDLTSGQVELTFLPQPVTLSKLEAALTKNPYHILHFVGHGKFIEGEGAALLLADKDNKAELVKDKDFVDMFKRLGQKTPQFIFLASCQTAKRPDHDPFQGLAPALIQIGVPALLAMQEKVHIPTAQAFTRTFYSQLFQHGRVDLACNAARSTVLTEKLKGSHIPVLFSRLDNNKLLIPQENSVAPRKDFEPETVYIRSGKFMMGSKPGEGIPPEETNQHEIELRPYRIGKYPVTNREYMVFLQRNFDEAYKPKQADWLIDEPPDDKLDHPVIGISWQAARAYCDWLSQKTPRTYRLPTEAEWEKAARGTEGRIFPWGNDWKEGCCTIITVAGKTTPVVKRTAAGETEPYYPAGASPFGCCDMVGNVQEWVSTLWGDEENKNRYPYPYKNTDNREDMETENNVHQVYRIYRGGDLNGASDQLRCSLRGRSDHQTEVKWRGFRVVCEA